jgi:hypothetical protein
MQEKKFVFLLALHYLYLCVCLLVFTFCFSSISCALKLAFGLLCHHHYHGLSLVKYHYTLHQEKALIPYVPKSGFLASSEPVVEQSKVKGLTVRKWDGFG